VWQSTSRESEPFYHASACRATTRGADHPPCTQMGRILSVTILLCRILTATALEDRRFAHLARHRDRERSPSFLPGKRRAAPTLHGGCQHCCLAESASAGWTSDGWIRASWLSFRRLTSVGRSVIIWNGRAVAGQKIEEVWPRRFLIVGTYRRRVSCFGEEQQYRSPSTTSRYTTGYTPLMEWLVLARQAWPSGVLYARSAGVQGPGLTWEAGPPT
jgi:hypothetical protein